MKSYTRVAATILPFILLTACAGKETKPQAEVEVQAFTPTETAQPEPVAETTVIVPTVKPEVIKVMAPPTEHKIFFDFDKSDIKSQFRNLIEKHAKYLIENPNVKVTIEGHCDERGTREYNMALGERRAYSVVKMLTALGVQKRQLNSTSYGEDRPEMTGHDESSWKQNRRSVFVYSE